MNYIRRCMVVGGIVATVVTFSTACFGQTTPSAHSPTGGKAYGAPAGVPFIALPSDGYANVPAATLLTFKRYKKTLITAYTEYNTVTCEQISQGAWTLLAPAQKYGKVSYGTITGHLANGACPDNTFTFAAIYYMWVKHNNESNRERVNAEWKTPDGQFDLVFNFLIVVPIVRPASETTVFSGWDAKGLGRWTQTLHPPASDPSFDFSYDTVRESDPGGGGPDTCWFPKSAYAPFTAITGGTWYPDDTNVWKFDHVGWFTTTVTYYRAKKRAPCGTKFPQQMQIKAQIQMNFVNYGKVNILGGSFTNTAITSTRAGQSKTVIK